MVFLLLLLSLLCGDWLIVVVGGVIVIGVAVVLLCFNVAVVL